MTRDVLVLDASPLVHFARSGELDTLAECLKDFDCVTTHAVRGELRKGVERHPVIRSTLDLEWLARRPGGVQTWGADEGSGPSGRFI